MSAHAATIDHHHDHTTTTGIPNKKLFMWAFLASDCMFFGMLIATHLIYRLHPTPNEPDVQSLFSIELTSFSTFILLMSSLLMALAVNACQKGNVAGVRKTLLGTIFFGMIFLACQVYEFNHFVYEKDLTLTNAMFGSTFYVLTGTHGCHVAIGIIWLGLMYVRTFKPVHADAGQPWLLKASAQFTLLAVLAIASVAIVMGATHAIHDHGYSSAAFGSLLSHNVVAFTAAAVSLVGFFLLTRSRREVQFGEANAIDVESMGLYWHFVDIVWIVIFTVVYLLEYV